MGMVVVRCSSGPDEAIVVIGSTSAGSSMAIEAIWGLLAITLGLLVNRRRADVDGLRARRPPGLVGAIDAPAGSRFTMEVGRPAAPDDASLDTITMNVGRLFGLAVAGLVIRVGTVHPLPGQRRQLLLDVARPARATRRAAPDPSRAAQKGPNCARDARRLGHPCWSVCPAVDAGDRHPPTSSRSASWCWPGDTFRVDVAGSGHPERDERGAHRRGSLSPTW